MRALKETRKKRVNMASRQISFYLLKIIRQKEHEGRDSPKKDGWSKTEYDINMD
jgi:hypothetical protein